MSEAIAVLPYVLFDRSVQGREQTVTVRRHELRLFETKITFVDGEFPIRHVNDMSSRVISGEERFLYLHTHRGVFSFIVREDPAPFVRAYKDLKRRGK